MSADIRLSVGFWDHPKTRKLIKRLGLESVRSLQILWMWCAQNRPNGMLAGMDAEDIELAAQWGGEEGKFFKVLLELRWIDETPDGHVLHEWEQHNPWASGTESRSGKARLSRLSQIAPDAYRQCVAAGKTELTPEEYAVLKDSTPATEQQNASSTPANTYNTLGESPANASATPAPAPAPSLSIKNITRDKSLVSAAEPLTPPPSGEIAGKVGAPKQPPLCPQTRILDLYHEILYVLPHMKIWEGDSKREGNLRARWRDCWKRGKYTTTQEGLEYWRTVFEYIRDKCPFLMGQVLDHEGNPRFRATLEWIVKSGNFAKIIEHKYEREVAA